MAGHGDTRKVVLAALSGNAAIAVAKFVAAYLSGSVAMLAEAVHSVADTCNQALLLIGMGLARRSDPERYPLGRSAEQYFWAFVVSLMLFSMGGVYAIYEGVHKLSQGAHPPGSPVAPLVVLVVSIVFEASSFFIAAREFKKTRGKRPLLESLFRGKDPTIPVVLLEDSGAVVGLFIALASVLASWLTHSSLADGIGSILIGVLLCGVGVALARDTHSLLIGEGATPEMRQQAFAIARETPGVEAVTQLLTLHLGPDTIILALKVRFSPELSVEELERVTDRIEERIRESVPQMKRIFIEADSDYDASLDPDAPKLEG